MTIEKPLWLTKEQKEQVFATDRGWEIIQPTGVSELISAHRGLKAILEPVDTPKEEYVAPVIETVEISPQVVETVAVEEPVIETPVIVEEVLETVVDEAPVLETETITEEVLAEEVVVADEAVTVAPKKTRAKTSN